MQPRDSVFEMYESICDNWGHESGDRYLMYQRDPKAFLRKFPLIKEAPPKKQKKQRPWKSYTNLKRVAIELSGTNPSRTEICEAAGYCSAYFTKLPPDYKIEVASLAGITLRPEELLPPGERQSGPREKRRLLFLERAREWADLGITLRYTRLSVACGAQRDYLSNRSSRELRDEIDQIFKESKR